MHLQDALDARAEAVPFAGTAHGRNSIDEAPVTQSALPVNARAIIRCASPSVLSAGRRNAAQWVLEFEPRRRQELDPLMGWSGGGDPVANISLRFPSREAAIAYARRQGLVFEVQEQHHIRSGDLVRMDEAATGAAEHLDFPLELLWAMEAPHLFVGRD